MNILILANFWFPISTKTIYGGIENVVLNQYKVLSKYGHNVKILASLDSEDCNFIEKYDFYSKSHSNTRIKTKDVLSKIIEVIDNNQSDIILAHIVHSALIKELSTLSIPIIFFNHNVPYMGMISKMINEAYYYATQNNCITVSPSKYSIKMNNNLVPNCIKKRLSSAVITDNCYLDVTKERNGKVISASRITKGSSEDAMAVAFHKSNRECEIYGKLNTEYEEFYNTNILPYLNDKVKYIGNIPHDQLLSVMSQSSLLVHSVWDDTYPNVIVESLACGLPAILFIKKEINGAVEITEDIGIDCKNLIVDLYRMRVKKASDLILDKIEYFFNSEYNTIEYRKYIAHKCREYFKEEKYYNKLENAIESARIFKRGK